MEALIEVYESDVNRIQIGQVVLLISENGGFQGPLAGIVKRIRTRGVRCAPYFRSRRY